MATVPEFISVLRKIRDEIYPEILESQSSVSSDRTAIELISSDVDAVREASELAISAVSEIENLTATAQTLAVGAQASASYNPSTGVLTVGLPSGEDGVDGIDGEKGDKGDNFTVDAIGTYLDRGSYNSEIEGFVFLDSDAGVLYFKLSSSVGDWSVGVPFGNTPVTSVAGKIGAVLLDKNDVGLNNVENTADYNVVANSLMHSGEVTIADSVITKSNANITYTGNGTTQDILTGINSVDFTVVSNGSGYYHDRLSGDCVIREDAGNVVDSGEAIVNISKVHIMSRSLAYDNSVYNGLEGVGKGLSTNNTDSEFTDTTTISTFLSSGVTVGTNIALNQDTETYILHQILYTHVKWGLTSQGKRYLTAYNPVTREVMTMYQGSGTSGHQIPNPLGIKLDYITSKNLSTANSSWWTQYNTNETKKYKYLWLNDTIGESTAITTSQYETNDYSIIESSPASEINNGIGSTHILYGFANSETKIITQYQGTGVAGNFVETKDVNGVAKKPRRVIIKSINEVANWVVLDSERVNGEMYLDTSSAESIVVDRLVFNINGMTLESSYGSSNVSGGQYIAIIEFDTTSNNDDTYFDLPTDDTNLTLVNGKLVFTDGRADNGGYNVSTQSYTGSIDFAGISDGIKYVGLDELGNVVAYDDIPLFNSETGIMYANDEVTPLTNPICFIDDKPYQITSETPIDRLLDYPSIPKNIMETLDVEFIKSRGNRKIIELGTIFNNNRYVIDNPFGNDNYEDCDVKAEVYVNGEWSESGWFYHTDGGYGTKANSMVIGVVIQTGSAYMAYGINGNIGGGHTAPETLTSAPARVIVTYIGEAK